MVILIRTDLDLCTVDGAQATRKSIDLPTYNAVTTSSHVDTYDAKISGFDVRVTIEKYAKSATETGG